MAPEDRDRSFDKAIARHLRSAAASSDSAKQAAGSSLQRDACPDTETLAAYHERSLLPEELNSWKEHIVACAHCQQLLANLELTDDIPLHAAEEQEVFAMADAQHAPYAQKIETVARPAAREGRRASRLTHGVRWRWIAPAGAIAAGLLVWIAMRENEHPFPSSNEVKIARNQEPAVPAPPASTRGTDASPEVQRSPSKPSSTTDALSSYSKLPDSRGLRKQQTDESKTRGALAAPSLGREESGRKDAERDADAYLFRDEKKADLDGKLVGGMVREKALEAKRERETQANARMPAPAQEQNLQAQNQNISPKVPGPAPLGQAKNVAKSKTATPAAPPPAAPQTSAGDAGAAYAGRAVTEMVMVSDSRLIAAPGSAFVWRPGRAGLIEFSPDGGRSWMRQPSGVLVDLLTGSATSERVCWIVGRAGAILLTTDGGAHWKLLSSPLKDDLGGIRAADALHATIWNARGTKYFATGDGGLTWEPAVHP
ncbi:MAG: hypothetical protein WBB89_07050 [Candidatus Acidiferrum sp.]